jgi:HEAT repeat protein
MGILDFFGGGSGPAKALKLKPKVMQKYGDAVARQKAIQQLGEMKFPEAVTVLLSRFTITVEPQTTDADEKDQAFELIRARGAEAIPSITDFLARTDLASSWAVRLLAALLPEPEVVGLLVGQLNALSKSYSRNPEKRLVLLNWLFGKDDPRIAPAVLPFLEDMADDVRLAALRTLGPLKYEPAREPVLQLLTAPETGRRVQVAAMEALADSGFGVQGFREKVEALASESFFVDKAGTLKRRGAPSVG